jgi:hypothetical protein
MNKQILNGIIIPTAVLCASFGCAGVVDAQLQPTNITWMGSVSVVTTNNVYYADYSWDVLCCQSINSTGPLTRNGNTFWYDFDIWGPQICFCQSIVSLNTTVTLGTLGPGVYTLITTSWGVPVATFTFTIPPLILYPIGFGGDGSFQMALLNGNTNANYVLQSSTNLVVWTSLSTNTLTLVPVLSDTNPVLPGPCFYRVQILGH